MFYYDHMPEKFQIWNVPWSFLSATIVHVWHYSYVPDSTVICYKVRFGIWVCIFFGWCKNPCKHNRWCLEPPAWCLMHIHTYMRIHAHTHTHTHTHMTAASESPTDVCPPVSSGTCKAGRCCSCNSPTVTSPQVKISAKWAASLGVMSVKFENGLPAGTRVKLGLSKAKGFRWDAVHMYTWCICIVHMYSAYV